MWVVEVYFEIRRSLGQLDDALHAPRKALGAELRQDDGQNGVMIIGQSVMIHALPCKFQNQIAVHY